MEAQAARAQRASRLQRKQAVRFAACASSCASWLGLAALLASCGGSDGGSGGADAGLTCARPTMNTVRPISLCTATGAFDAVVDGCFCNVALDCTATVEPGAIHYSAKSVACPGTCTTCEPLRGQCAFPTTGLMPNTTYHVDFDGNFAFDVTTDANRVLGAPMCISPAPIPPRTYDCSVPGTDVTATDACVPAQARSGEAIFVNATACVSCDVVQADCDVVIDGHTITATPRQRTCACATCGDCSPTCSDRTFACALPPLPAGTYHVNIGGRTAEMTVVDRSSTGNTDCRGS